MEHGVCRQQKPWSQDDALDTSVSRVADIRASAHSIYHTPEFHNPLVIVFFVAVGYPVNFHEVSKTDLTTYFL